MAKGVVSLMFMALAAASAAKVVLVDERIPEAVLKKTANTRGTVDQLTVGPLLPLMNKDKHYSLVKRAWIAPAATVTDFHERVGLAHELSPSAIPKAGEDQAMLCIQRHDNTTLYVPTQKEGMYLHWAEEVDGCLEVRAIARPCAAVTRPRSARATLYAIAARRNPPKTA